MSSSVSIIGFGAFGRLAARHLRGHARLCVCDPRRRAPDLPQVELPEAAGCDVVIVAVPLSRMEAVLRALAPHLRPGAIVVDVASVKIEPARLMLRLLPDHVEILATHPLLGPESARNGVAGHRIAWCPLRGRGHLRLAWLLRRLGLRVIATTPDAHDREMAVVQGLTHLIARGLADLGGAQPPGDRKLSTADRGRGHGPVGLARTSGHDPEPQPPCRRGPARLSASRGGMGRLGHSSAGPGALAAVFFAAVFFVAVFLPAVDVLVLAAVFLAAGFLASLAGDFRVPDFAAFAAISSSA